MANMCFKTCLRIVSLLITGCILFSSVVTAQTYRTLNIEECYTLARQNYPLIKQANLIKKTKDLTIENIAKGYLPQVNFNGQATYQSDVTSIPINIPNISLPTISKDQYKIYGEADQVVYDGGNIKYQKQAQEANEIVQQQNLEVNLYALKDRINQLFFGILLVDEQLKQNDLQKKDIQNGIDKTQASIDNGTAFRSSLDELKAELLKTEESRTELKSSRKAYLDMLSLFIHLPLDENTVLTTPQSNPLADTINRPEITLYDYQKKNYDVQDKMLHANTLPRVNLFLQGGYGKPGVVNMFKTDFEPYYIGGIRFNWLLGNFYTLKNDKRLLNINRSDIDVQKETFLFNTSLTLHQQSADVAKYIELIKQDQQIILLRNSVKNASAAQLENGVITAHDYITQVNAEDQSRQSLILHRVQLLLAQYNYQTTSGN